ncbi:phage GP46 family protein [Asaia bogorensis]|uniref:phage GP46 family protein n=1 Tax=Asaia bogorensis TaxID=91915 RepID=UPI000EFBC1EA|nr:phage GP46 family protein [Asaia bogorensis]
MSAASFSSMKLGINPVSGGIDLVIDATGDGRGRIAIDRTPATPLLIALCSDRLAAPDDIVPEMQTALPGTQAPLFSRRGWVGDILLESGQRYGSRAWLLSRARASEATRVAAESYTDEAVASIADYHGIDIQTSASWYDKSRGILLVTASASGLSVNAPVTTL